jgi:hypothetical protein
LADLTPEQQEAIDALAEHGSQRAAAQALGISRGALRSRLEAAARHGHAPGHFESGTAPGYLMGKVTIQRGPGGVERVWERQSPEASQTQEKLQAFIAELAEPIKGLAPLIAAPTHASADLLSVYPIGDQHHGMYAEATQTGAEYNTEISSELLTTSIDVLCATAPPSGTAILLDVGDFHHANCSNNETPASRHAMHVTASYGKVMYSGAMALVHCTLRLLEKHAKVIVWIMPGNHNPDAAFATALAMSFFFHNEPRVEVDLGNSAFKFMRFGKNLIGAHHGDGPKLANLPLIMAVDRPEDWAATEYRVWHCGHIHHRTFKEEPGVDVETHRTLAPSNAWDHKKGYRSKRECQRIDYHVETGEWNRQRCDLKTISAFKVVA